MFYLFAVAVLIIRASEYIFGELGLYQAKMDRSNRFVYNVNER